MYNNYRGGFGGGNNMQALMRQAQKMQEEMQKAQEEVDNAEFEGKSAGGKVTVKVSGKKDLLKVTLDPVVVDPDDVEMLEDLIVAAFNEAGGKADAFKESKLGGLGGLGGLM